MLPGGLLDLVETGEVDVILCSMAAICGSVEELPKESEMLSLERGEKAISQSNHGR